MCQACIPDDVPKVKDVVPAGFTVVHLADLLMSIIFATLLFSLFTISADFSKSYPNTTPLPIPVIETPIRASFSVVSCHISLR